MKIVRIGDEIALVSRNSGRAFLWLLVLELALLGGLLWQLALVVDTGELLVLPSLASLALVMWTALQIKPDVRIVMNVSTREGQIVRIAPLTGQQTAATFPLDDVQSLSLLQTASSRSRPNGLLEYVVAIELRNGARHVLSSRGPMLAYRDKIARFAQATGIDTRIVRRPVR